VPTFTVILDNFQGGEPREIEMSYEDVSDDQLLDWIVDGNADARDEYARRKGLAT